MPDVVCWLFDSEMHRPRLSERERQKIIIYRYDFHRSYPYIARKMKCSLSTIHNICSQHKQHVDSAALVHHGRKKALSSSMFKHMINIIRYNKNITASELQRHLFLHDNINISIRTVRRYRRSHFHPAHEILIPKLTLDHHLNRCDYYLTHINDNFHTTVFSDEKMFCLDHTSNVVWLEDNEPIPTREIKSTHTKVMVWGGIWYNGRTELGIVDGKINYKKYIQILQQYLLPSMPSSNHFLFQHDNAKPHQKIEVMLFLRDYAVRLLDPYPAHSPDFNPIEHVWSWMVQYVKQQCPTDNGTLIEAVQSAWTAIPQSIIQAYIDDLPTRLKAVYDNGGARLD